MKKISEQKVKTIGRIENSTHRTVAKQYVVLRDVVVVVVVVDKDRVGPAQVLYDDRFDYHGRDRRQRDVVHESVNAVDEQHESFDVHGPARAASVSTERRRGTRSRDGSTDGTKPAGTRRETVCDGIAVNDRLLSGRRRRVPTPASRDGAFYTHINVCT